MLDSSVGMKGLTPRGSNAYTRDIPFDAQSRAPDGRSRITIAELVPTRYWSRLSEIARAVIMEWGKHSPSGEYFAYASPESGTYGLNAEEPLMDSRKQSTPTTGVADPYGLITRWKTRTDDNSLNYAQATHDSRAIKWSVD